MSPNATPQIASDAMAYQGHSYIYGGAPGTNGQSGWDCSSFCNWVIGHDLSGAIPGFKAGSYTGAVHGPATGSWLTTGLCSTISIGKVTSAAQPGDLIVWQTHMGIYTGNGDMISALNSQLGTRVTTVSGGAPGGELLTVRRYNSSLSAAGAATTSTTSASGFSLNPVTDLEQALESVASPLTSSLLGSAESGILKLFGVSTVKDLLIRGGLLLIGFVILIIGIHAAFKASTRDTSGRTLENIGIASGSAAAVQTGRDVRRRGFGYGAASEINRRRETRNEISELTASGASDIRTAQKPQGRPTHPGRRIASRSAESIASAPMDTPPF